MDSNFFFLLTLSTFAPTAKKMVVATVVSGNVKKGTSWKFRSLNKMSKQSKLLPIKANKKYRSNNHEGRAIWAAGDQTVEPFRNVFRPGLQFCSISLIQLECIVIRSDWHEWSFCVCSSRHDLMVAFNLSSHCAGSFLRGNFRFSWIPVAAKLASCIIQGGYFKGQKTKHKRIVYEWF